MSHIELSIYDFTQEITKDYNIELTQIVKTMFNQYPIKNGKRKIKANYNAIIVDKKGNEYPYMLTPSIRNEDKLVEFDYIYITQTKSLKQVIQEANIELQSSSCKISEGNGWYSNGTKYIYKNFYCKY